MNKYSKITLIAIISLMISFIYLYRLLIVKGTTSRTDVYDHNDRVIEERYQNDQNTATISDDVLLYTYKFYYKNENSKELSYATKVQNNRIVAEYYYHAGTKYGNHGKKLNHKYLYYYNGNGTLRAGTKLESDKTAIEYFYLNNTKYAQRKQRINYQYRFYYNPNNTLTYATKVQGSKTVKYYFYKKGTVFNKRAKGLRYSYNGRQITAKGINYLIANNFLINNSKRAKFYVYCDLSGVKNNSTKTYIKKAINDLNKNRGNNNNSGIFITYVNTKLKRETIKVNAYNKLSPRYCSSANAIGCATYPSPYSSTERLVIQNNLGANMTMQVFDHEFFHNVGLEHVKQKFCGKSIMVPISYRQCIASTYSITDFKADLTLWKALNK